MKIIMKCRKEMKDDNNEEMIWIMKNENNDNGVIITK